MMNRHKYTLMALIAVLLWGSLYTAVKLGYTAYGVSSVGDILYFAGVRFTICGAMITMFAFITRPETFQPAKKTLFADSAGRTIFHNTELRTAIHGITAYRKLKTSSLETGRLTAVCVLFVPVLP